jgi:hypothetical protein
MKSPYCLSVFHYVSLYLYIYPPSIFLGYEACQIIFLSVSSLYF